MKTEELRASLRHQVPPEMRGAYDKVVAAGMKFMFDKKTNKYTVEQLTKEGEPAQKLGEGVAALLAFLSQQSKGAFPQQLVIPAGVELIMHAVEFADGAGIFEGTPEIVGQAIQIMVLKLFEQAGVKEPVLMGSIQAMQQGG